MRVGAICASWCRCVAKVAIKYKTYTDFKNGSRGAFKWAVRNGVIKEVTAFMWEITDADILMRKIT